MRTENEIKSRIVKLEELLKSTRIEYKNDEFLSLDDEINILEDIDDLKTRIGLLKWVLNEKE